MEKNSLTISITKDGEEFTGVLMPRSQVGSDDAHIIIKLTSGYNIGLRLDEVTIIRRIKSGKGKRSTHVEDSSERKNLPNVSILSTGGTIASKVDYRTGAVNPALSAQDLYDTVPELRNYANVHAKVIMSVLSENILPADWMELLLLMVLIHLDSHLQLYPLRFRVYQFLLSL